MSDVKMFKLPDVGEGLTEAEIVTWNVKPGDTIKVNDVIVEIETAKSLVELPSPYAGTVTELLAAEGDTVNVGSPIIAVETGDASAAKPPETGDADAAKPPETGDAGADKSAETGSSAADLVTSPTGDEPIEPGLIGGPAPGGRTSVLVGYGPRTTEAKRRPRKVGATPSESSPAAAQVGVQHSFTPHATPAPDVSIEDAPSAGIPEHIVAPSEPADTSNGQSAKVLAKPPVRKLAKDLGVDLTAVTATGPEGTITRDDVSAYADGGGAADATGTPAVSRPEHTGERETRVPVKGVRKMTAQAMVSSAFTAPHVTEWITIDATRTMKMVQRLRDHRDFRDVKVSPLLIVARAVCTAIRRTPEVNAAWDEAAQEIVLKNYVNLGIAAATPRGLIVPNVKDAETLRAVDLAKALGALTATARDGKTQPAEMSGGTFTITNVGVFGVDAGTPIINPGESAILCMGAIRKQPWVIGNKIRARWITTLAMSFDHRIVDGEQGSRFLADVASLVEDPGNALLF
jgi:2-oxoisovalerate dehydrogenase E2 component (dihydrolipoyl transacylase)